MKSSEVIDVEELIRVLVDPAKSAEPPKIKFVLVAKWFKTFPDASRVDILSGASTLTSSESQFSSRFKGGYESLFWFKLS